MTKLKRISRGTIRALLIKQKGRCAISGLKITPKNVSLDHIMPLARTEFKKDKAYGKAWLVHKKINALKGTLTMKELYEIIKLINKQKLKSEKLAKEIIDEKIKEIHKEDFDKFIKKNYNKDGSIKN